MIYNPVMVKELRGRMRGMRAFAVLTAFLLFLSCLTILIYTVAGLSMGAGGGIPGVAVGKVVFSALFLLELFLVAFLTPAFTAGSFSGERERRTYDLLLGTTLTVSEIVWGKLVSSLTYVLALVLASVPLFGTAFLMGGVAPEEVAIGVLILVLTAIMFGSVGLFFSSFLGSTVASTVLSYAVALLLTAGIPALGLVGIIFGGVLGRLADPDWFQSVVFIYSVVAAVCTNPFLTAGVTEGFYGSGKSLFFFTETIGTSSVFLVSPWIVFTAIYAVASAGLNLAAVGLLRRPSR